MMPYCRVIVIIINNKIAIQTNQKGNYEQIKHA